MKQIAVIGLGRFGSSVAKNLTEKGQEVIGIDKKEELVQDMMDVLAKAICLDATDEKAMKAVGIQSVDAAVCAIGTDVEASILIVLLLKELGVPVIVGKAISEPHGKVLAKIGASMVIMPEKDMGETLANMLVSTDEKVIAHTSLPGNTSIIEFIPPKEFLGSTLRELDLRTKYNVNIIAVKKKQRDPETGKVSGSTYFNITPMADEVVEEDDVLVIFGENEKIEQLKNKE